MSEDKMKYVQIYGEKVIQYATVIQVPITWDENSIYDYSRETVIDTWTEIDNPDEDISVNEQCSDEIEHKDLEKVAGQLGLFEFEE